ncbi:hypothetical protein SLE2022_105480 [Rubroshorea leprosula]
MILFRTLKELSTKRLTADQRNFADEVSSHLFDYSWQLWQSDVQTIFHGFQSDKKCMQVAWPVKEVSPALLNAFQSFLPYYLSFQNGYPKF